MATAVAVAVAAVAVAKEVAKAAVAVDKATTIGKPIIVSPAFAPTTKFQGTGSNADPVFYFEGKRTGKPGSSS
jgi:hypothetical protein